MLEETQAGVSGNVIVVTGSETLRGFFDNGDNLAALGCAVREVTGGEYKVVFEPTDAPQFDLPPLPQFDLPPEPPEPPKVSKISNLERFLSDVKTSGIQITIRN
jgi:hypothetical protein